jgi:hypothetical protein
MAHHKRMPITPEVREFIKQAGLSRSTVAQIAAMLPDDDLDLDNWISEAILDSDSMAFHLIVFAALSRERPVDARHLSTGAKLAGGSYYIAAIAFRVHGEMPEYLLEGLCKTAIHDATHAMALLTIVFWCDERRGGVYPDQLIPEARTLARRVTHKLEVDAFLLEIAIRTEDAVLEELVREHYPKGPDAKWQKVVAEAGKVAERSIEQARSPIMSALPETPVYGGEGGTVRRAVPRIGRNDACHCGSGRKYKHCHYEKDRERLQHSSEVAGLTRSELSAEPEPHLTLERLEKQSAAGLARLDPAAIPRHLLTDYFVRLALVDIDQAAGSLEKLGYEDDLEDAWFFIMFTAVRAERKDIGERLMRLRRPFGLTEEELRLSQRLLLAQDEPAKWLRLVQAAALQALKTENSEELLDLAFAVAHSEANALGLVLYRGVLPFVPPVEVKTAYEDIVLPLRERLDLAVDDPLKELLDNRTIDAELALREAEEKFEAKRREVRELKQTLDQIHKDLARKEREPAADSPVPALSGESDSAIRQLREKVKGLESDLKEKHNERNALQRRLERIQARVESLTERAQPPESAGDPEADAEEELLLPQQAEENHPLRLIEFPRNFLERLNEFPHHVARGAMAVLGRLAGGDPAAFSGAKCLKGAPGVMRQRVGIDFRLLFRLLSDRIQVIDLIPRQDLERKIKTLR